MFPNFIGLIRENQKTSFSMFLTSRTQTASKLSEILGNEFFHGTRLRSERDATGEPRVPNGNGPCSQMPRRVGPTHPPPRCSDAADLRLVGCVMT
jgi:hypothetical protein